jgi:hypothetical protein
MEHQKDAFGEGWAHFYAADVWNDHGQTDCTFKYYKASNPTIDCEWGQTGFELAYMESTCNAPYAGYGVELDWLRQLWNVHTVPWFGTPPSFTSMVNWISTTCCIDLDDAYTRLHNRAYNIGGTLWYNWDWRDHVHGIDH